MTPISRLALLQAESGGFRSSGGPRAFIFIHLSSKCLLGAVDLIVNTLLGAVDLIVNKKTPLDARP